jgi:ribosomal protein L29
MKESPYSVDQLSKRSNDELFDLLRQLKSEMLNLRIMKVTSQLKDVNKIKISRRSVAKIMTELNTRKKGTNRRRKK